MLAKGKVKLSIGAGCEENCDDRHALPLTLTELSNGMAIKAAIAIIAFAADGKLTPIRRQTVTQT
jgi:hypothetical protein